MLRTRRQFLSLARAAGGAALAVPLTLRSAARAAQIASPAQTASPAQRRMLNPLTLEKFVDPLPIPGVAPSAGMRANPENRRQLLPYYRIELREIETRMHRDVPPTRQWGYGGAVPGPTIETRAEQGLWVEWVNALPRKHFLPIDHNIHGAEADKPEVRVVTHVHGAKVPPESDGYPEAWQTPGQSRLVYYPNRQEAATLWYHDHAMGITRLNIFAGLFGTFIIRDAAERELNLPDGPCDMPIVIYDRALDRQGQLLYPVSSAPDAPFVSEFYGNSIVCNGKIFPYLDVEPRRYRFRLLNAANGRFFHLSLSENRPFHQIASDVGLLSSPVELRTVVLFPAERAEVIVDFAGLEGQEVLLRNDSDGILQFRVAQATAARSSRRTQPLPGRQSQSPSPGPQPPTLPALLRPVPRIPESQSVRERLLTLSEHDDAAGNSMQMLLNETHWDMPVTEKPELNSTEIWSFINLSGDAHPVHLHLVRFQVLDRRPFDPFAYNANKSLVYTGPAMRPEANELGWKDTVRADPGMVTRIIVRFEGYIGRYVWHCHLLEHEDNEMMRPYEVVAPSSTITPKHS